MTRSFGGDGHLPEESLKQLRRMTQKALMSPKGDTKVANGYRILLGEIDLCRKELKARDEEINRLNEELWKAQVELKALKADEKPVPLGRMDAEDYGISYDSNQT